MRKIFAFILVLTFISFESYSQVIYARKMEIGFMNFRYNTVQYDMDPNSDWKGYNLDKEQDGIDLNLVNGISLFEKRFFAGAGIGYQNFEGINGITVFADFEYLPFRSRFTPLFNVKVGYDHIWNQYEGGTGTALGEFVAGINYRMTEKLDIFLKSGMLFTQQSFLIPIKIGVRF